MIGRVWNQQSGLMIASIFIVALFVVLTWSVLTPLPVEEKVVEKEVTKVVVEKEVVRTPTATLYSWTPSPTPTLLPTVTLAPTPAAWDKFLALYNEGIRFYQAGQFQEAKNSLIQARILANHLPDLKREGGANYQIYRQIIVYLIEILHKTSLQAYIDLKNLNELQVEFELLRSLYSVDGEILNEIGGEKLQVVRGFFNELQTPKEVLVVLTPTLVPIETPTLIAPTPTAQIAGTPIIEDGGAFRVCYVYRRPGGGSFCKTQAGDQIVIIPARRELEESPYCTCFDNPSTKTP